MVRKNLISAVISTFSWFSGSLSGETYKYNVHPPLPAQCNLAPPPTLYPQQPMSASENYRYPRYSATGLPEVSSNKSKRADINVWSSERLLFCCSLSLEEWAVLAVFIILFRATMISHCFGCDAPLVNFFLFSIFFLHGSWFASYLVMVEILHNSLTIL